MKYYLILGSLVASLVTHFAHVTLGESSDPESHAPAAHEYVVAPADVAVAASSTTLWLQGTIRYSGARLFGQLTSL